MKIFNLENENMEICRTVVFRNGNMLGAKWKSVVCELDVIKQMNSKWTSKLSKWTQNLQFAKRKSIICKMEICNFKNGMCNLQTKLCAENIAGRKNELSHSVWLHLVSQIAVNCQQQQPCRSNKRKNSKSLQNFNKPS